MCESGVSGEQCALVPAIKNYIQIFTYTLLQTLATIPVSTATPERTFSNLRRLKTYLRNTTSENRLNGLALMNIHHDIEIDAD